MDSEKLKLAGVVLLGLIALAFIYQMEFPKVEPLQPATQKEFLSALMNSSNVFVIEDLRNASTSSKQNIMQCGTDLAGSINTAASSLGLPEKNVSVMVLDQDSCITADASKSISYKSIEYCEALSRAGIAIRLQYGAASVYYYKNAMAIGMQNYTSACSISPSTGQNSTINQTNNSGSPNNSTGSL